MRVVISLLSIFVALAAVVPLAMGMLRVGATNSDAERFWSMALSVDAIAMILLGLTAAVLIWWRPRAAELDLRIAVAAGVLGALFTFAITITAEAGIPGPVVIVAGMLIGGGVQALAALSAALLARRWARGLEGSIA
jgi:hypothetical protein